MKDEYLRRDLYEAEKDTLILLMENLEKRLEDLKMYVSLGFGILAAVFSISQIVIAIFIYFASK